MKFLHLGDLSNIDFHSHRDDLVPHMALDFDNIKNELIKEVVIGPKCKARKSDIERFIRENGFECRVIISQGTYR